MGRSRKNEPPNACSLSGHSCARCPCQGGAAGVPVLQHAQGNSGNQHGNVGKFAHFGRNPRIDKYFPTNFQRTRILKRVKRSRKSRRLGGFFELAQLFWISKNEGILHRKIEKIPMRRFRQKLAGSPLVFWNVGKFVPSARNTHNGKHF